MPKYQHSEHSSCRMQLHKVYLVYINAVVLLLGSYQLPVWQASTRMCTESSDTTFTMQFVESVEFHILSVTHRTPPQLFRDIQCHVILLLLDSPYCDSCSWTRLVPEYLNTAILIKTNRKVQQVSTAASLRSSLAKPSRRTSVMLLTTTTAFDSEQYSCFFSHPKPRR